MYSLTLLVFKSWVKNFIIQFVMAMFCLDLSHIAVITVKGVDYYVNHDRKSEAIHLLENSVLDDCR